MAIWDAALTSDPKIGLGGFYCPLIPWESLQRISAYIPGGPRLGG